jgi:HK97 family phage portal protein
LSVLTRIRSLLTGGTRNQLNDPRYGLSFGSIIPGSDIDTSPITTKREAAENYSGWVFAAASFIAEEMRALDWNLYRITSESKDEWVIDNRNPLNDILHKPNPTETWGDLLERSDLSFSIHGEFYWHIIRNGDRPIGLALILPHWVDEPVFDREGRHASWRVTVPGYAPKQLPVEDVIRVFRPHPLSPWAAASLVEAAAVSHYFDLYLRAYGLTIFRNDGGVPAGLLSADAELTSEQADLMREQWRQRYSQARGEVAVLGKNSKYQPISIPMNDLKFMEIGDFNKQQILAMFRVPPSLLGEAQDVNRASIDGHLYSLQRHALRPRAMRYAEVIRSRVLPAFLGTSASGYWWQFENVVSKDRAAIQLEAQTSLEAGAITINEYRQKLDLDPVPDGDVYRIPTTVSLTDSLMPAEATEAAVAQAPDARAWEASLVVAAANRRADAAEAAAEALRTEALERRAYAALRSLFASWWRDRDGDTLPLRGLEEHHLTTADLPDVLEDESLHEWVERLKGAEGKRLASLSVRRATEVIA